MNFLGDKENFLQNARVNQWPDRRDRAVRRPARGNKKICRPDRYVPETDGKDYRFGGRG
ncbi:MAG: hypothetical protein LKJ21_04675 [Oscillospiraceae bacterium]|jgi:hypothetical protein|nr:hypothetical protein [Oscillospiraceae bacterium]MCI1990338.1 hypothetical protein [Oscillospiraceae bacterium]MCI2034443.1 hypothetical protein [Oscillospiraceae bacterium]